MSFLYHFLPHLCNLELDGKDFFCSYLQVMCPFVFQFTRIHLCAAYTVILNPNSLWIGTVLAPKLDFIIILRNLVSL